jgi:hypothetical protein
MEVKIKMTKRKPVIVPENNNIAFKEANQLMGILLKGTRIVNRNVEPFAK